jgi:hypothetical protein
VDFVKGLLLSRENLFAGCCESVVSCLEVFWDCYWIRRVFRGDFRLKLRGRFTSVKTYSAPESRVRAYRGCVVADQPTIVKSENLFRL